jgi:hypothetical protein
MIGFAAALLVFVIVGFSVAYFGGLLIWFVIVLGASTCGATPSMQANKPWRRVMRTAPQ